MKRIIVTFIFVACTFVSIAQKNDLYAVLVALMPSEGKKSIDWEKSDSTNLPIKWENVLPIISEYGDYKEGHMQMDFPRPYTCNKQKCSAEILLRGDMQKGASFIEITCPIPDSINNYCMMRKLLGPSNCQITEINNREDERFSFCSYELLIPGKSKIWAVILNFAKRPTEEIMSFYSDEEMFKSKFSF